ncbi:MAG: fibrobacter succinogenes major paralogous domain-containing protein [Chlorobiales bacterium]|nr:fibrobacter succinogenes major paralogous domain-containing protein [Chlorobiales bacterium]
MKNPFESNNQSMKHNHNVLYGLLIIVITLMTSFSDTQAEQLGDVESNTYKSVTIGNQVWMQDNLNVSKYRNGDLIRQAKTSEEWNDAGANGEGVWSYYNNDPAHGKKYGKLYNWFAVHDPRGLAPLGWHIPSDKEWTTATSALGGEKIAGGKMKFSGISQWQSPNVGGNNSSNFSALPSGLRGIDGKFNFIGESAYFWSNSEYSTTTAWYRVLNHHLPTLVRSSEEKVDGLSVRCIAD